MIITETNIPDITPENLDSSKLSLANNIIQNVYPLFDEVYTDKRRQVDHLKRQIKTKHKQIVTEKQSIENLLVEYKRQKKISKLLDRLDKLVSSGLVYDGAMQNETVILLKIIPKLSNEKLNEHLSNTLKIINKRFSR